MFEGSLVESTPLLRSRSRKPIYTSIAIQAAFASAILLIPLLHPEIIPIHAPELILTAPPMPKPAPPPPPRVQVEAASASSAPQAPAYAQPRINTSSFTSLSEAINPDAPPTGPIDMSSSGGPGLPSGILTGSGTSRISVVPASRAGNGPLHISTGVSAGLLLAPIQPIYPQIAKISHTQGIVVVQAIISTSGHIESAHVVSGPAMLMGAALDAVRSAHYRPYLLNGQPTTVETTITINFHMDS